MTIRRLSPLFFGLILLASWAGSVQADPLPPPVVADFRYLLDGGDTTVTGTLGGVSFTNARWQFSAVANPSLVTSGLYGIDNLPYYFLPATIQMRLDDGNVVLTATLDPVAGADWGVISIDLADTQVPGLAAAGMILLSPAAGDPAGAGLTNFTGDGDAGLYNTLTAPGIWHGGAPSIFSELNLASTSSGQFVRTSFTDISGTGFFQIAPATIPEPGTLSLTLIALAGATILHRHRARKTA